ncbi:hypothetical protein LA080_006031 [Diaporthe eres]|nr:hypothetical protein LA080_006031 [Diaporthe eres]
MDPVKHIDELVRLLNQETENHRITKTLLSQHHSSTQDWERACINSQAQLHQVLVKLATAESKNQQLISENARLNMTINNLTDKAVEKLRAVRCSEVHHLGTRRKCCREKRPEEAKTRKEITRRDLPEPKLRKAHRHRLIEDHRKVASDTLSRRQWLLPPLLVTRYLSLRLPVWRDSSEELVAYCSREGAVQALYITFEIPRQIRIVSYKLERYLFLVGPALDDSGYIFLLRSGKCRSALFEDTCLMPGNILNGWTEIKNMINTNACDRSDNRIFNNIGGIIFPAMVGFVNGDINTFTKKGMK